MIDRSGRQELLGALNPGLRVPTLVLDDGRSLGESDAIMFYFADGTPYLPDDRFERAQVLQWLFFEQYSHEPYIAVARFWAIAGITPPDGDREAKLRGGTAALRAMDAHLTDQRVPGRRALHDRGHRALRLHARGPGGRLRARALSRDQRVAGARRDPAGPHRDHRLIGLLTPRERQARRRPRTTRPGSGTGENRWATRPANRRGSALAISRASSSRSPGVSLPRRPPATRTSVIRRRRSLGSSLCQCCARQHHDPGGGQQAGERDEHAWGGGPCLPSSDRV